MGERIMKLFGYETNPIPTRRGNRFKDLTGQRFGRLVVVEEVGRRDNKVVWRCRCDCGSEKDVRAMCLQSSGTKSCGCLRFERSAENCKRRHQIENSAHSGQRTANGRGR